MTKARIPSPIGPILIESDGDHLLSLWIGAENTTPADPAAARDSLLAEALAQIGAYFEGRLARFDLPLAPAGSERGQALRAAICAIPAGETRSYGGLARIAGSSPRAIGQACARNPFPLIVPCHRVIGSGGAIGQYSGGSGIITKRWLLEHERPASATFGGLL